MFVSFKARKKIVALWSIFSIIFNMVQPAFLALVFVSPAYAQEVSPSPIPTEPPLIEPSITPNTSPLESIIPSESPVASPTIVPSVEPSIEPSSSPSPTPDVTIEPIASVEPSTDPVTQSISNTPENSPNSQQSNQDSSRSPPATQVPSPTSSPIPEVSGKLEVTVITPPVTSDLDPVFDFDIAESSSALLITDKPDYAPTDLALISGSGFLKETTYRLVISSTDEPATRTTAEVLTDLDGNLSYSYQLDGIYRPNYKVEAFLGSTLITTITFTDSQPNKVSINSQSPNPVIAGNNVTFEVLVDFVGNSTPCTVDLTIDGPLPSGVSLVSFSPSSVTNVNPNSILSFSTIASSITGSFTVKANGTGGCSNKTSSNTGSIVISAPPSPTGTIQVRKDVSPDDNTKWDFTISGTAATPIKDLGDGELSAPQTLTTGPYTITESGNKLTDYTTSYSCTDGTTGTGITANVTLSADEGLVCTFTNKKIEHVKVNICHATADPTNPYTNPTVDDDSIIDGSTSGHGSDDNDIIPPFEYYAGTYPGRNWDAAGQEIWNNGCLVKTNLTVIKEVVGDGPLGVSDFPLFVNGNPVVSGVANLYLPGDYTISETNRENYTQTSITCNNVLTTGAVHLVSSINTTCTIINTYVPPTITKSDVTICKQDNIGRGLVNWRVSLLGALQGSYLLPVNGTTTTSSVLPLGDYVVKGSGTYKYSTGESWMADSEYSLRIPGQSYSFHSNPVNTWVSGDNLTGFEGYLEMLVNGNNVNWGTFNPEHNYYASYLGYSGSFGFNILDDQYGDNSNSATNPLTASIYSGYTGLTGADGCITFADVPVGNYSIEESQQNGWSNVSGLGDVVVDEDSELFTVVNKSSLSEGSILGYKYEDLDGSTETTTDVEPVSGWVIDLFSCNSTFSLCGADPVSTTTTADDGSYSFTGLVSGYYRLVEQMLSGWKNLLPTTIDLTLSGEQTILDQNFLNTTALDPDENITICHATASEKNPYNLLTLSKSAVVRAHLNHQNAEDIIPEFTFNEVTYQARGGGQAAIDNGCVRVTNEDLEPVLRIQKLNNATGGKNPGDLITYKLIVDLSGSDLSGVTVTDVSPEGFVVDNSSLTGTKNGIPFVVSMVQNYASPGVWDLGNLSEGDIVELSYQAKISNDQDGGIYSDSAYAEGNSEKWGHILAMGHDSEYVDEVFVGTDVQVNKSSDQTGSAKIEREINGDVLGASTSNLPSTGVETGWLIFAFGSLFAGIFLTFGGKLMRKFLVIAILVTSHFFLVTPQVLAADPSNNLSVRLEQPITPTRVNDWKLSFSVLDRSASTPVVTCYVKKPGALSFVSFGSSYTSVKTIGDNGYCHIDGSVMNDQGDYEFYVSATSGSATEESKSVTVKYDTSGPGTPNYFSKEHPSICRWVIKFHTADDAGATTKVEIYSSDKKSFDTNNSTRVGTVGIGSNQDGTFIHDRADSCDREWYYVIRAFDSAGNQSDYRGDEVVITSSTTSKTSSPSVAPAIVLATTNTNGSVLGKETSNIEENDSSGEDKTENSMESAEEKGLVAGASDVVKNIAKNNKTWGILGAFLLSGIAYVFFRKNKKNNL